MRTLQRPRRSEPPTRHNGYSTGTVPPLPSPGVINFSATIVTTRSEVAPMIHRESFRRVVLELALSESTGRGMISSVPSGASCYSK